MKKIIRSSVEFTPYHFGDFAQSGAGFTLLEFLIILGTVVLLLGLTVPALRGFQENLSLSNNAEEIMSVLRLAQSKTMASEGRDSWGVYFSGQTHTLFKGISFVQREPASDKVYQLSKRVEFFQIDLEGGGSEVVFGRIRGTTANIGSLSLRLKADQGKTKTIYVSGSGQVQLSSIMFPSQAERVKDSRHVHLDYSRQINLTAEKLVLTFNNGLSEIKKEINIAENLQNGQIYWEDEVVVDSSSQKIKIHTHRLNESGTQFCIHRSLEENSKALKIDISGDASPSPNLVGYDIQGLLAKGSSIFVSDPLVQ
ncbi:MAG: hypothetical protein Q8N16_04000 [bacterium]|nr:hypothetical protein [bacterium]